MFNKVLSDASRENSNASKLFKALGVDITQGPQAAFEQFARAINNLPDPEQKVAAMRMAFGRAGDALIPMISGMDDATEKARRLGLVMSKETAKASEEFNDALTTLGVTVTRLNVEIVGEALPSVTKFAKELLTAKQHAEGLAGTLALMFTTQTMNPGAEISKLSGTLEKLRKQRADLAAPGFANSINNALFDDLQDTDRQIAAVERRIAFLKDLQKQQALALGGGDTAGERARMGVSPGGRINLDFSTPKIKPVRDDNLLGRQLQEDQEEWVRIMAEAAAATDKYNQTLRDQERQEIRLQVARAEAVVKMQEILDEETRRFHGFDENGNKIAEDAKKMNEIGRELGLTFSSAFEDAVIAGKKFSDVLRGLAQDIARVMLRKSVTEPLGNAFSKLATSALDGLFKADGGPVMGGQPYIVGERGPELFVPGSSGSIVPNHALGGVGGGVSIVNHYQIDSRTDRSQIIQLVEMGGERTKAQIMDSLNRGGEFALATRKV